VAAGVLKLGHYPAAMQLAAGREHRQWAQGAQNDLGDDRARNRGGRVAELCPGGMTVAARPWERL
jgi:hypothetical protein